MMAHIYTTDDKENINWNLSFFSLFSDGFCAALWGVDLCIGWTGLVHGGGVYVWHLHIYIFTWIWRGVFGYIHGGDLLSTWCIIVERTCCLFIVYLVS